MPIWGHSAISFRTCRGKCKQLTKNYIKNELEQDKQLVDRTLDKNQKVVVVIPEFESYMLPCKVKDAKALVAN